MGATYRYTTTTIKSFLRSVAKLLRNDHPSYEFDPKSLKAGDCVAARVVDLQMLIAAKTTPSA